MAIWDVEMTDTYAGETNYSWVTREKIEAPTASLAIRRFKAKQNIKVRHRIKLSTGDFLRVDLEGACVCIMATCNY